MTPARSDFAAAVQAATDRATAGAFGPRKVFIVSVWRDAFAAGRTRPSLTLDDFKRRLLDAHQRGELVLARVDLAAAADPELMRDSECQHAGATYHLVERSAGALASSFSVAVPPAPWRDPPLPAVDAGGVCVVGEVRSNRAGGGELGAVVGTLDERLAVRRPDRRGVAGIARPAHSQGAGGGAGPAEHTDPEAVSAAERARVAELLDVIAQLEPRRWRAIAAVVEGLAGALAGDAAGPGAHEPRPSSACRNGEVERSR